MGRLEAEEHLELDAVAAWPQARALAARIGALVPPSSVAGELASKGCDMRKARRPPPAARSPSPAPARGIRSRVLARRPRTRPDAHP